MIIIPLILNMHEIYYDYVCIINDIQATMTFLKLTLVPKI